MVFYVYDQGNQVKPSWTKNPSTGFRGKTTATAANPQLSSNDTFKISQQPAFNKKQPDINNAYTEVKDQNNNNRLTAITAAHIMSSPVSSISSDTSSEQLMRIFQQKRYRHMPVVEGSGDIIGIISDRDALHCISEKTITPTSTVKDIMVKSVLTCTNDTDVSDIAKTLLEEHIGALPVVDEHGKLQGIITRSDVLRVVVNRLATELWA